MSKLISRLLIFFIGIPVVIAVIVIPFCDHLPLHVLICAVCALASSELHDLFSHNAKLLPKPLVVFCAILPPLAAAAYAILPSMTGFRFRVGSEIITLSYAVSVLLCLAVEVFGADEFSLSNTRLSSSVFILTYTGFSLTFVSRISVWKHDGKSVIVPLLCAFALMVFMCDSLAWFFGVLFGKNNKGIAKASPNKSVAGFLGGFAGSVAAALLCRYIWQDVFWGSPLKAAATGLCIAFCAVTGDLAESVFKRSAGIKDSGSIVPGRGGMLDSVDSIVMSAPVFYLLTSLFWGPFTL